MVEHIYKTVSKIKKYEWPGGSGEMWSCLLVCSCGWEYKDKSGAFIFIRDTDALYTWVNKHILHVAAERHCLWSD